MKTRWFVGVVGALMLAGGGMAFYLSERGKPDSLPPDLFDRTEYPKGTGDMVGDSNGRMCHEVRKRDSAGEHFVGREYIEGVDFRTATPGEKKAAIRASARRITERAGLMACAVDPALPFPGLASDASAQPHCLDCGGGCGSASCPAHVVEGGGCQMQGPDCIITIVCCSSACNCW